MHPRLSIVVLTLDEARHIGPCLEALAAQTSDSFEVIVVDAASTDGTVAIVQEAQDGFPVPLHLEAADQRLAISQARNRGVSLAKAEHVAFVSADTELDEAWVERALEALSSADVVYGRQVHAPYTSTLAAAVRSLRYVFPRSPPSNPARFASNVAGAYHREVLERFPLGTGEDAVDDLLIATRAARAGYEIAYDPEMVVVHHDVDEAGEELTKNAREGLGWGRHAGELGLNLPVLAWGGALVTSLALIPWVPVVAAPLAVAVLWAPAVRRAVARQGELPPGELFKGVVASPPFDLVFLANYLRGLATHGWKRTTDSNHEEMEA